MPRSASGTSLSHIFREYFRLNPKLALQGSNTELYDMFKRDHPEIELTKNVQGVCANIKSLERKRLRDAGEAVPPRSKAGRKPGNRAVVAADAPAPAPPSAPIPASAPARPAAAPSVLSPGLESLEERIDDLLHEAREMDRHHLGDAIRYLRRARNLVSMRIDDLERSRS